MTKEQLVLVDKLKNKFVELNDIISEINKDPKNPLRIDVYQENWHPMMNADSCRNAVKYVNFKVSENIICR